MWDVHEQVCVAAMDCADMETAEVHVDLVQSACSVAQRLCVYLQRSLSRLRGQFPDSVRVQRLRGMLLEARGK